MTISAKIIADSVSPNGARLTTMQLRYPRFIHAEFMTHRVFSRNASSSRAIPFERLVEDVMKDTAMPIEWGKNQKGMQAGESLSDAQIENAKHRWGVARDVAVSQARALHSLGLHKQIVNRILEPFSHINVLVTATDWDNFFHLRRHPDAQPEIHELADKMFEAMEDSIPYVLEEGEWHLPYVTCDERASMEHTLEDLIKTSVARCARVSYLTHDGRTTTLEEDIALYARLVGGDVIHASPAEHVASALVNPYERSGNFCGFLQYRKTLPNENVRYG